MKQNVITSEGEVLAELGNSFFKVSLDPAGQEILCTISGKIRKNRIRIMAGDRVEVELSPYDLTKGRITRRLKIFNKEKFNNSINKNKSNKNEKK